MRLYRNVARRCALLGSLLLGTSAVVALSGCGQVSEESRSPAEASVEQAPEAPRIAKGRIEFLEGYQSGYVAGQQRGMPLLVFFTAEWCHFCHQMADEAFTDEQVVGLSRQFVCVLVDADREPEVCRQFRVKGYPTVQFLSPRGVPLNRIVGKQPGHQLVMEMQAALQAVARRGEQTGEPARR